MPPKEDLRRTAQAYGVRFKGPVAPSEWPREHKRNFDVVRTIQFLRYEDYMKDDNVSKTQKSGYRQRVKEIRQKVHNLLGDTGPNETSWRELETPILERFDRPVICARCNHDLMEPDYKANCWNQEAQARLDNKRALRKVCDCRTERLHSPRDDEDEEQDVVFRSVKDQDITHGLDEDLGQYKPSMQPDRVIGLKAPSYIARNETHFPVKGRESVLLPFLILEAKREKDAPGFQSILYQTAFPVRRLLQAQANIDSRDLSSEPCLVWFFAYRGEIWRLHAATLNGDKTTIYELWQGTIHSHDGALQLLLIVDFIWSWARDVYRSAIRGLILQSKTSFRHVSPVSTDRYRHSSSLFNTISPAPTPRYPEHSQIFRNEKEPNASAQSHVQRQNQLLDASTLESFSWNSHHGIVRHSNIAEYDFRCYNVLRNFDDIEQTFSGPGNDETSVYAALHSLSVELSSEQLNEIASSWTTGPTPTLAFPTAEILHATFCFQTYCNPSTWQIKKMLTCIVWQNQQDDGIDHRDMQGFTEAVLQVLSQGGRDSVWLALQRTGLVLQRRDCEQGLEWKSFAQTNIPEWAFDTLTEMAVEVYLAAGILCCVSRSNEIRYTESDKTHDYPRSWEQDTRTGGSMLAIRSESWPDTCPKFCLFVLPEVDSTSTIGLHRLLQEAMSLRNFYGDIGCRLSKQDWQVLHQWRKALAMRG